MPMMGKMLKHVTYSV